MIARLIRWSIANRLLVLLASAFLAAAGIYALLRTPVDALPDLSDVQVIIRTTWPGQSPQIVEDQVTYPLTTTMLSVPGAKTVRGYSFFGDSFVYVLFEDATDLYWARSRVLEYLNQVQSRLPAQAKTALGPDATGVGWVYQYALVDKTGRHDLSELRSFTLKTVNGGSRPGAEILDPLWDQMIDWHGRRERELARERVRVEVGRQVIATLGETKGRAFLNAFDALGEPVKEPA